MPVQVFSLLSSQQEPSFHEGVVMAEGSEYTFARIRNHLSNSRRIPRICFSQGKSSLLVLHPILPYSFLTNLSQNKIGCISEKF